MIADLAALNMFVHYRNTLHCPKNCSCHKARTTLNTIVAAKSLRARSARQSKVVMKKTFIRAITSQFLDLGTKTANGHTNAVTHFTKTLIASASRVMHLKPNFPLAPLICDQRNNCLYIANARHINAFISAFKTRREAMSLLKRFRRHIIMKICLLFDRWFGCWLRCWFGCWFVGWFVGG